MNSLFKIITDRAVNTDFKVTGQSILVEDLEVSMSIGIHDFEKAAPQRVMVALELEIDETSRPQSDHIDEVISYASLIENIEKLATAKHYDLVETFAHDIAASCLNSGSQANRVSVKVFKPDIMDQANVGVTITAEK